MANVRILDTTLRDGEQSPGAAMTAAQRLEIALALEAARIDVIEAGFPAASPDTAASVKQIAVSVSDAKVAAFSRLHPVDIEIAWESIRLAASPVLFTCCPTSDEHIAFKLKIDRAAVLERIDRCVRRMAELSSDTMFAAEDATRTDRAFLVRAFDVAARAGARTVVMPDTVGYMQTDEYADLVRYVRERLDDRVALSVHTHDDFGLATANTLAAIRAGADEVQVTVNGIGERAGNCALEEIVTALRVRAAYYGRECRFVTERIAELSTLVATATGMPPAKNKAIVGRNAFLHESGIHQDGVLKQRTLYEMIPAEFVGRAPAQLALGRSSGRRGVAARCEALGVVIENAQLDRVYERFVADERYARGISDDELLVLVAAVVPRERETVGSSRR